MDLSKRLYQRLRAEVSRRPHDMSNPTKAEEHGKYCARWLKHLVPLGGKSWEDEDVTCDEDRVPGSLIRVWDGLRIALWGESLRAAW